MGCGVVQTPSFFLKIFFENFLCCGFFCTFVVGKGFWLEIRRFKRCLFAWWDSYPLVVFDGLRMALNGLRIDFVMADITLYGHIEGIRYNTKSVLVVLSEDRCGFVRRNGERVSEELLTFRVVFNANSRSYISSYFSVGNLVKVRGSLLPYVKRKDGTFGEGYTILGQLLELAAYPKRSVGMERRMLKESVAHPCGEPNVDSFMDDDF